jgi:hypothetical protein
MAPWAPLPAQAAFPAGTALHRMKNSPSSTAWGLTVPVEQFPIVIVQQSAKKSRSVKEKMLRENGSYLNR